MNNTIICMEVLEYLEKQDGERFPRGLEAKKFIGDKSCLNLKLRPMLNYFGKTVVFYEAYTWSFNSKSNA